MKKIVEKVKTHRKVVHAHLKKHHKKYFFGLLSAALLIKIIPAMIAGFATMHFNYSFANDPTEVTEGTNPTEVTEGTNPTEVTEGTDPAEVTEGTDPAEVTEGTDSTEVTEGTDPAEVTEGTDPAEVTEGTDPAEVTEGTDPAEVTEGEGAEVKYKIIINANNDTYGSLSTGIVLANSGTNIVFVVGENKVSIGGVTVTATATGETPEYEYIFSGWETSCGDKLTGDCFITGIFEQIEKVCLAGNIQFTGPLSGQHLKSEDVELGWTLRGSNCSGKEFTILLYVTGSSYETLGTVPSNSGRFIYTGITENYRITNFAIHYTGSDGEIRSLGESDTFVVDNVKPTITGVTYSFTPSRTTVYGLNDQVNISFEGSEELTGITINVLGRNATFTSKSGLKYNHTIQLSSRNNTGQFGYNISFRDLAGNTGYYEYFNSGLVSDATQPDLSGSMIFTITHGNYKKTTNIASLRMEFSENSNVEFTYILSGGKAGETIKGTNSTLFTAVLEKALVDTEDKIYKYALIIEDLVGNKKYYAGTFQLSGNHIENNLRISNSSNINNTGGSIKSALDSELKAYSGCKNKIKTTDLKYTIKSKYNITVKMPEFSNTGLQRNAEDLVKILVGTSGLSKSTLTGLTEKSVSTFNKSLNNYLMAVKIKREPNTCGKTFILLPSLYTSALLRSLKSYNLIK